jgi:integrase
MSKTNTNRRAYGSGSLKAEPRSGGRWVWIGRWRPESDAKQLERVVGPKRTAVEPDGMLRKDAETEFRRLMDETEATPLVKGPRMSLDALDKRYRTHLKRANRKRSTITAVESASRVHLLPFFVDKAIDAIKRDDVDNLVETLEGRELSAKTIHNYVGILSAMLSWASAPPRCWLASNPCDGVELPGVPERDKIRFLDEAECGALMRNVQDGQYAAIDPVFYVTAIEAGLRHGELCALRVRDVDFAAMRIRVRQNWVLDEFGTPKSKRSSRSIPMTDELGGALDRMLKARGDDRTPDALVFPDPLAGGPMDKAKTLRRYRRVLKSAGIDATHTLHDLRHTFGTRMAAGGVPMRTLQEWMGHRHITTTERYADYAPSLHEHSLIEAASAAAKSALNLPSISPDVSEPKRSQDELGSQI